jgi:hypothetical protein
MAGKTIAVSLEIDGGKSIQSIKETEKAVSGLDNELKNLQGTASKEDVMTKKMADLKKAIDSGNMSMRDYSKAIKEYQTIAMQAGRTSPIGQEALKQAAQLTDRVKDLKNEVNRLANDGVKLQGALQLGGSVVAGMTAVKGATAMLGIQNENLMKTLVQLQGAQALLSSIEQIRLATEKESYAMMLLKTGATKLQTVAQWALNVAMDANPLGLIVLALSATVTGIYKLITAYDELGTASKVLFALLGGPIGILIVAYNEIPDLIENIILKMKEWAEKGGAFINALLFPMMQLIKLYERFFGEVVDVEKIQQENLENEKKRLKEKLDNIDKLRKKENEAHLSRQSAYDLEIDRMEAEGKSSHALKMQKLNDILEERKAVLKANQEKLDNYIDYYKNLALLSGQSEEQFKANAKKQGVDLDALLNEALERQKKYNDEIFQAETDLIKQKNSVKKQGNDDESKLLDELHNRRLKAQEQLDQMEIESIQGRIDRERAMAQKRFDDRIKGLSTEIAEENQLIKEYEKRLYKELGDIDKQEEERLSKFRLDHRKKELDSNNNLRMMDLDQRQDWYEDIKSLQEEFYDWELEALKEKYENQLITKEEYDGLIREAEIEHQQKMAEIAQQQVDLEDNLRQESLKAKLESTEQVIQFSQMAVDTVSAINDFANQIGNNRIQAIEKQKQKELQVEGLTARQKYEIELKHAKAQDEIAKKQFNRDKGFRIAQAGLDTAGAIVKGIAMFGPPPSPAGIAAIASASVIGLAQIGTILATKFEPSASNISPPSINTSIGGGGSGGAEQETGLNNNDQTTLTSGLLNGGGGNNNPFQVVMLESDVTNMQDNIAYVNAVSSI